MVLDRLLEPDESSGSIRRVEHSDMCRSITRETGIDKSGENNISVSVQVKGPWAASLVGGPGGKSFCRGRGRWRGWQARLERRGVKKSGGIAGMDSQFSGHESLIQGYGRRSLH